MTMKTKNPNPLTYGIEDLPVEVRTHAEAIARIFRGVDVALSASGVKGLTIHKTGPAPGWTDGEVVNLSIGHLPAMSRHLNAKALAIWLGVNYHELGHVLFTPRANSTLGLRIKAAVKAVDSSLWQTWNLAEDQRQERLLIARFAPLRAYLTTAIVELIVNRGITRAWPLLAGRVWIPGDARAMARAGWVAANDEYSAHRIATLIGEYQALADPAEEDAGKAYLILLELSTLLREAGAQQDGGCGNTEPTKGEDEPTEADTATGADDPNPGADDEGTEEGDDEATDGDDTDGEGEGDSDSDEDGEDGDGSGDGEDGDEGEGTGDGEGTEGTADVDGGTSRGNDPTTADVANALEDAVKELLKAGDVARDLADVKDAVEEAAPADLTGDQHSVIQVTPTEADLLAKRAVTKALRTIVENSMPGWNRRVDHGRLNVGRYVSQVTMDPDTLFDKFEHGAQDETKLETVIVLDTSVSMRDDERINHAARAVWAIRHAIRAIEGTATVLTFDSRMRIMARPGQNPGQTVAVPGNLGGSTLPAEALDAAYRLLSRSEAVNRLCVVVTDGQWSGGVDQVKAMRRAGVTTVVIGIGMTIPYNIEADVRATVTDASELAPIFKDVAASMMKRSVSKVQGY
jgi:von Willebrand factor type A domain